MKTNAASCLIPVLLLISLSSMRGQEPLRIGNESISVTYDSKEGGFTIQSRGRPAPVVSDGKFSDVGGVAEIVPASNKVFGSGTGIQITAPDGTRNTIEVYSGTPFVLFRAELRNGADQDHVIEQAPLLTARVDPAIGAKTLGTGGLKTPMTNPGSYAFLAFANPTSRNGLVCGWLTHDRGSGVVFSPVGTNAPLHDTRVDARIDYGCLRITPKALAGTESFLIGYFDDVRAGLESYADAVAKNYSVILHPKQPGYCTWYMEKHSGACDEVHLKELSNYAAKNLGPYGFGFIQIDDGWQAGERRNGSAKNFTAINPKGPYPGGMKATAEMISGLGLTPGIWFMPFAGTWNDPWFKDHQDWFVKRRDGKPYDTAWGGTCLDMTNPAARDYVRGVVTRIGHKWGYRLFKMDGFWTGSATKQIYVNDGYKADGIGDAVFHDPNKTNIEALRDGVKLFVKRPGRMCFSSVAALRKTCVRSAVRSGCWMPCAWGRTRAPAASAMSMRCGSGF